LNPLHVLLVTADPGLRKGVSAALAEHGATAEVEAVAPEAAWPERTGRPDLLIVDTEGSRELDQTTELPAERYPDSLVLRLWSEGDEASERDVECHSLSRECGYVRREDLEQIAPVVLVLARLSERETRPQANSA
jgi:DNA-binding NarL/FixJ family response regulator